MNVNQIAKQTRIARKTIKRLIQNEGEGECHLTLRLTCRKAIQNGVKDWYTWISWQSVIEKAYKEVQGEINWGTEYLEDMKVEPTITFLLTDEGEFIGAYVKNMQKLHDDLIDLERLAWNTWADAEQDETQLVVSMVGVA